MICVYAPNMEDTSIFDNLTKLSQEHFDQDLIVAGDFNDILDTSIDRSPIGTSPQNARSRQLNQYMGDCNMLEVWRESHPTSRGFSFFSPVHSSHSRIYMIFVCDHMIPRMTDSQYLSRSLSDHVPLCCMYNINKRVPLIPCWRMRVDSLSDLAFREAPRKAITEFFAHNLDTVDSY